MKKSHSLCDKMKAFFVAYQSVPQLVGQIESSPTFNIYEKVPQAVAQITDLPIFNIPWGHNAVILEKIKATEERLWYAQKVIENGLITSLIEVFA